MVRRNFRQFFLITGRNSMDDKSVDSVGNKSVGIRRISFFNMSFWDLWLQKLFRNFASVKYQWLMLLYVPIIWGMFNVIPDVKPLQRWITPTLGLSFLGGGFITLALGRIYAKTSLKEIGEDNADRDREILDTDK
jgi:hypothetical protein